MITLSDGSTYLHRTTSPVPIYRSTKDTKNNPLWNPSSQKLANVEEDEAGRLKRFRGRFGRGWDAEVVTGVEEVSYTGISCWDLTSGSVVLTFDVSCRREKARKHLRPSKERRVCLISFPGTDKRQRRRVRLQAQQSRSRRAERVRVVRSEHPEDGAMEFI